MMAREIHTGAGEINASRHDYLRNGFATFFPSLTRVPRLKSADFDLDRDHQHLALAEVADSDNSPDLQRFKGAGGKLISYTGWNDAGVGVEDTLDFYEDAEKIMGRPDGDSVLLSFVHDPGDKLL